MLRLGFLLVVVRVDLQHRVLVLCHRRPSANGRSSRPRWCARHVQRALQNNGYLARVLRWYIRDSQINQTLALREFLVLLRWTTVYRAVQRRHHRLVRLASIILVNKDLARCKDASRNSGRAVRTSLWREARHRRDWQGWQRGADRCCKVLTSIFNDLCG
jgi:hypothetical protein